MSETPCVQASTRFSALLAGFECRCNGKSLPLQSGIDETLLQLRQLRERDAAMDLVGNGGSAAIASHVQTDVVNKARLRAHTLHDPALLTCMSNDYGYPAAFATILARQARQGDLMICISSSGASENTLSSVDAA